MSICHSGEADAAASLARLFIHLEKLLLAAVFDRYHLRLTNLRAIPITTFALVSSLARPLWVVAERN